jgi:hypothetical protein
MDMNADWIWNPVPVQALLTGVPEVGMRRIAGPIDFAVANPYWILGENHSEITHQSQLASTESNVCLPLIDHPTHQICECAVERVIVVVWGAARPDPPEICGESVEITPGPRPILTPCRFRDYLHKVFDFLARSNSADEWGLADVCDRHRGLR